MRGRVGCCISPVSASTHALNAARPSDPPPPHPMLLSTTLGRRRRRRCCQSVDAQHTVDATESAPPSPSPPRHAANRYRGLAVAPDIPASSDMRPRCSTNAYYSRVLACRRLGGPLSLPSPFSRYLLAPLPCIASLSCLSERTLLPRRSFIGRMQTDRTRRRDDG